MIFSKHQDPTSPARVDGSFITLYNLRPAATARRRTRSSSSSSSDTSTLTGVNRPATVCHLERTPVGVDHRNTRANLLTVDTDGNLFFEGIIGDQGDFTERGELLAAGIGRPLQMARAGRFLVLRLSGGHLFYLMWEGRVADYTVLGRLPGVPRMSVERVERSDLPMYVDPVVFPRPVVLTAPATPLPPDAVTAVDEALTTAWRQTLLTARSDGRFVQPVKVRVALRMFDGSLYGMTEAVAEGTADDLAGYGRALLPPMLSEGYLLGVEKSQGGVPSYRLQVTLEDLPSKVWQSVVKSVEVYVSDEPQVLDGATGTATYSPQTSAVVARLGVLPRQQVIDSISATRMRCLASIPVGALPASGKVTVRFSEVPLQDVDTLVPPVATADCISGAGAFLHMASDGVVATMRRNNPFAVASSTDAGTPVHAMKPLPSAGGAYTRSYLYLMTDGGITALTHDAQGRHTNCRPIAPYTVGAEGAVVHGADGVWALSSCGMLMLMKGSAMDYVMSGLDPGCTLAWDKRHNELWIIPPRQAEVGDHAMVLCTEQRLGYTRHYPDQGELVSAEGMLLHCGALPDGRLSLTDLEPAASVKQPGLFVKEVEVPAPVRSGRMAATRSQIGLCSFPVRVLACRDTPAPTLAVNYALPAPMQPRDTAVTGAADCPLFTTLYSVQVGERYDQPADCSLVFRRPDCLRVLPDWRERYRISGSGHFESVTV